jgi:hypothetical protein
LRPVTELRRTLGGALNTGPSPITQLTGHVPPARWSRRFTQGSASVTLCADRAELINSAVATLYAYRHTTATSASRWTVTLRTGVPIDYTRAEVLFTDGTEHDIGPRLIARSLSMPEGRAFWIPDRATLVHRDHLTCTITAHCADPDAGMEWAVRLVRQAMTAQLLHHGAIYAHAAALVHRGVGVLIAGPKGAGKTTALLSVLSMLGADFVTNDRLLLHRDRAALTGYAWPMPLRVGTGSLHAVPGMTIFLPRQVPPPSADAPTNPTAKIEIEPEELRRWLPGGTITGTIGPRLMLWPHRSAADTPPEPIPANQVRDTLVRTQFFMHDPQCGTSSHRNHWLLDSGDPTRAVIALTDIADLVARTLPCWRIPVTDNPAALVHWVRQLLRAPQATLPATGEPR